MISISNQTLTEVLDLPSLMNSIEQAFSNPSTLPSRHAHDVEVPGRANATLLLMPAWQTGKYLGLKTATIFPSNGDFDLPSVSATFLLLDGMNGIPLATMDGKLLTALRTAATSALASKHLSLQRAKRLLMIGAGALARPMIKAHTQVRPVESIQIWNRTFERAASLAQDLRGEGFEVEAVSDLETAVRRAEIISCATLSTCPLIRGDWVRAGTHIDLVGAFTRHMRESDNRLIENSEIFVDTYEGAKDEAGDLLLAAASSDWRLDSVRADLHELVTGKRPGRRSESAVTVFKSVGCALEDLAAATLAFERIRKP